MLEQRGRQRDLFDACAIFAAACVYRFAFNRDQGGADGALLCSFEVATQIFIPEGPRQRHRARRGKRQVEGRNTPVHRAARVGEKRLPVLAEPFIEAGEIFRLDRCCIASAEIATRRIPDALRLPAAKIIFGAARIISAGRRHIPRRNHRNGLRT